MPLILSGNGHIVFPATQVPSANANTLDDYEEGTWTGSLGMHSTPSTVSEVPNVTITATGTYTKIGRLCQISIYFDVTAYSNHVAYFITGLPFTSGNATAGYPIAMGHQRGIRFVYGGSILSDATLGAIVGQSNTRITLQSASNTSAFSGWYYISNEPGQGKYIAVSGTYDTAN
jgi:hypothetical protein